MTNSFEFYWTLCSQGRYIPEIKWLDDEIFRFEDKMGDP